MKIAFLSDIHANLPALLAALEVADRARAERVVVAGDVVGDGPHPVEVIAQLLQRPVAAIRGNVDRKVLGLGTKRGKLEKRLERGGKQRRNRAWTALQLLDAPEERAWLAELPAECSLDLEGRSVLVVHGSPLGDTDYLYPSLTPLGLRAKLEGREEERPSLLVSGHSHIPFVRAVDGVVVVNCGSVGRPADGDRRGSLALVEVEPGSGARAEIVRFPYPVDQVAEAIEARGVPGVSADEYRRGVKP
jgi:putative phosphoesterase